ncbi:hypothetical protein [Bacillus horti]|uniref:Regulatory protein YycH domain-containing protein n=1 Tax=Caldalkalibacillus horti TaxID=77523 RepID=A0ABT9W4H5_9BACI|nr:hypothetical protein [Bacillus horti]MDQ0168134.1 hypothetical protein [Bacillus horti]
MRLSKKTTLILIVILVIGVLVISELTTNKESNSYYQLTATPAATIESSYQNISFGIPEHLSYPTAMSPQQVAEWEEEQFNSQNDLQKEHKSVPEAFTQITSSISRINEGGRYFPLDFEFPVPVYDLIPNSRGYSMQIDVMFHTEGFWLTDMDSHSPTLHLHGIIPEIDTELADQIFGAENIVHISHSALLDLSVSYGKSSQEYSIDTSFSESYLVKDEEAIYFLLEASYLPLRGRFTAALLPTDSDIAIALKTSYGSNKQSDPVAIPFELTLGEEYRMNGRTLSISPWHRIRFEKMIVYKDFILFEATSHQSIEQEILSFAEFNWSLEDQNYRADLITSQGEDLTKLFFVTEVNQSMVYENLEELIINSYSSHLLHDIEVRVPLEKLEEGELASYLHWIFYVDEFIEGEHGDLPTIRIRSEKKELDSLPTSYTIEHSHNGYFLLEGKSKEVEGSKVVFYGAFSDFNISESTRTLNFQYAHSIQDDQWLHDSDVENIDISNYEFDLILPSFFTQIYSYEVNETFRVEPTGVYYEPR